MHNRKHQNVESIDAYIKVFEDAYVNETINVTQILLCGIDDNICVLVRKNILDHLVAYIENKYYLNETLLQEFRRIITTAVESNLNEENMKALLRLFIYQTMQLKIARNGNEKSLTFNDNYLYMYTMERFLPHYKRINYAIKSNPEVAKSIKRQIDKLAAKKSSDHQISTRDKIFPKELLNLKGPETYFKTRMDQLSKQIKEGVSSIIDNHATQVSPYDSHISGKAVILLAFYYMFLKLFDSNISNALSSLAAIYIAYKIYNLYNHTYIVKNAGEIKEDLVQIAKMTKAPVISSTLNRLKSEKAKAKEKALQSTEPNNKKSNNEPATQIQEEKKEIIISNNTKLEPTSQPTVSNLFLETASHESLMSARRFLMEYGLTPSQIKALQVENKSSANSPKRGWSIFSKTDDTKFTWLDGQISKSNVIQIANGVNSFFLLDVKLVKKQMKEFGIQDSDVDFLLKRFVRVAEFPLFCARKGENGLKLIPAKSVKVIYNKKEYAGTMNREMKVPGIDRVICFKLLSDDKRASLYIGCWYIKGIHTTSELSRYFAADPQLTLTRLLKARDKPKIVESKEEETKETKIISKTI